MMHAEPFFRPIVPVPKLSAMLRAGPTRAELTARAIGLIYRKRLTIWVDRTSDRLVVFRGQDRTGPRAAASAERAGVVALARRIEARMLAGGIERMTLRVRHRPGRKPKRPFQAIALTGSPREYPRARRDRELLALLT